jgi:uncharacterized protein YndB with AHSA1/START domain/predicted enzyme related to lactoylglutathione lyase
MSVSPRVAWIQINVTDLAFAIEWYAEHLGFRLSPPHNYQPGAVDLVVHGEPPLFLHAAECRGLSDYPRQAQTLLCFDTPDLDLQLQQFRERGVEVIHSQPEPYPEGRFAAFRDPFGNVHGLVERSPREITAADSDEELDGGPILDSADHRGGSDGTLDHCISHAVLIRADAERVFDAIATAAGWDSWFTSGTELDPREGGMIRFRWRDWGPERTTLEESGLVLKVESGLRFEFLWHPQGPAIPTRVRLRVEPDGEGTVVRVVEDGYRSTASGLASMLDCACGWGEALTLLKVYLEHGIRY